MSKPMAKIGDPRHFRSLPTKLYRHFDGDGQLLYVGISVSALFRMKQHRDNSHWFDHVVKVTIETYPTWDDAFDAETLAIHDEKPIYNIKKVLEEQEQSRAASEIRLAKLVIAAKLTTLNPVYSTQEAAKILRCGDRLVTKLIKEGRLRSFFIGKTELVTGWALMDFLEYVDASERVGVAE